MSKLEFTDFGECERCRREKLISRTGICETCASHIDIIAHDEKLLKRRLKELNSEENSIVRSLRGSIQLETFQKTPEIKPRFDKLQKERDLRKQRESESLTRLQKIFKASPQDFANARQDDIFQPQLIEVNDELMRWLAKHPEAMRELSPRKFEEVVAGILRDQGHSVQLTPATRDGGRDIIAVMKTAFGELLAIVECKRWLPPRKVGLEVVERFLYVLREKEKANIGMIATTTAFSPDAKKSAQQYEYLLKLADFDRLREMAKNYGSWQRAEDSQIWTPKYAAL